MNPVHLPFESYQLDNGLTVILHHDGTVPVAAVELMYHVGSKNEVPGKTGLAHLFEHMMFKGSLNVPDGEHFRRLQAVGAYVNGSTSEDRTNYYELVPADKVDLALFLEADRMGNLLPALTQEKLDNQRDVVKNERRQSYENQPYGLVAETISAALYPEDHPYHWPVIGSMRHLDGATLDDVSSFFRTYYAPNNAVLVVAGGFEKDGTRQAIEKHFGSIPRGPVIPAPMIPPVPAHSSRSIVLEDRVHVPRLTLAWHSAPWNTREDALLDVFTDVLSAGRNSRLYKGLVIEQRIVENVFAYQHGGEAAGRLVVQATPHSDRSLDEVHQAILNVVEVLLDNGPTAHELSKSINMKESHLVHGLAGMLSRADALATYETLGSSAGELNNYLERFSGISAVEVSSCASRVYAQPGVVIRVVPRGSSAS